MSRAVALDGRGADVEPLGRLGRQLDPEEVGSLDLLETMAGPLVGLARSALPPQPTANRARPIAIAGIHSVCFISRPSQRSSVDAIGSRARLQCGLVHLVRQDRRRRRRWCRQQARHELVGRQCLTRGARRKAQVEDRDDEQD